MTLFLEVQNPAGFVQIPSEQQLSAWAQAAWRSEHDAGVVLRIVDSAEGQQLNQQFRGKDYPTNILSFPYEANEFELELLETDEEDIAYLGDLVICLPVVEREANEQQKPLQYHWAHLLVHGLLHLQGFDHIEDEEALVMEQQEIDILCHLGMPNPYEN